MNEIVIKANGLTKIYGTKRVVDNVSMTVYRGDIYGFIGSNGAGKTTFLRMVMGLVRPNSGSLELFGQGGEEALTKNRARIGFIIETPALILSMNAYDCLYAHKLLTGKKDADIPKLLDMVGLGGTGAKKVRDFSLGMKQRLSIAQALLNNPEILILDEPTNGMDPQGIVEMRNFLKHLSSQGITILMSSHILSELEQLATRFGIIANGKLIDEFSASQLAERQVSSVTIRVDDIVRAAELLASAVAAGKCVLPGEGRILIKNGADFKEINKLLVVNGVGVEVLAKETADLEKYFVQKVGAGL